jgi:acetoin utilization protein AcuB
MFYIHGVGAQLAPYQIGAIRLKRAVEAMSGVSNVEASSGSTHPGSPAPSNAALSHVIDAYEKAVSPDSPRRRVIYARDLMTKIIVTIRDTEPIQHAFNLFAQKRFRHIPVVSLNDDLLGIISERDVLRHAAKQASMQAPVSVIMHSPVLVAAEGAETRAVAKVLFDERIGCMPIVNEKGALLGIITRSDILRTLLIQAPLELWR